MRLVGNCITICSGVDDLILKGQFTPKSKTHNLPLTQHKHKTLQIRRKTCSFDFGVKRPFNDISIYMYIYIMSYWIDTKRWIITRWEQVVTTVTILVYRHLMVLKQTLVRNMQARCAPPVSLGRFNTTDSSLKGNHLKIYIMNVVRKQTQEYICFSTPSGSQRRRITLCYYKDLQSIWACLLLLSSDYYNPVICASLQFNIFKCPAGLCGTSTQAGVGCVCGHMGAVGPHWRGSSVCRLLLCVQGCHAGF